MKKYVTPLNELLDSVRDIEGFPVGKDEDILALSNPPYYTACPNPYINDFIEEYGKPYDEDTDDYNREPFAGDVSEGKNDPIYNAHSYHTKVPHKAIMKYIEHYTDEGDIVFDGFCGTGMTGVAAQMLNRKAILSDLSPIATFIAHNYNTKIDVAEFENEARRILYEVEQECGWMYETMHTDGKTKGKINYTVWSDVFICPFCGAEIIFYEAAVDKKNGAVKKEFPCPACHAKVKKTDCTRAWIEFDDKAIGEKIKQARQIPVLINYSVGKKRYEKIPDEFDLDVIRKIDEGEIPYWFPVDRMPEGDESRRNDRTGITHVHHFYTKRNLWVLAKYFNLVKFKATLLIFESISGQLTNKLSRYNLGHRGNGPVSGTLYISSMISETNVLKISLNKLKAFILAFNELLSDNIVNTSSAEKIPISDTTIDYIFIDPPFGQNLMYSELNFLWEAWLKVYTNNKSEAIINSSQNKQLPEYSHLMFRSFQEYYRVLKPNRWITVEFHNSKSSVWNAIQDSMTKAGFIIANVTILDKQQGSFKQVTSTGAVKNDLVISAYKPKGTFQRRFLEMAGEGMEEEFIRMHLSHLPAEPSIERTEQMLYSKLLAFYVQRTYTVKYNSSGFYKMLRQTFVEEDGFWFNREQLTSYREYKKKMKLEGLTDIAIGQQTLFVSDEKSAIIWLYSFLNEPKTFQEIHPAFTKVAAISNDRTPELMDILKENFIHEHDTFRKPQSEDEKLSINEKRERALLLEFDELLLDAKFSGKKIKECRKQAVLYGFEYCYKHERYRDILEVALKLDKSILENDSELNEFVEVAQIKIEGY
ncbi:MAG: DNA methylase [Spirochaetales bacterium]|nr:DNA methylase [Spirochaetales bacterium]